MSRAIRLEYAGALYHVMNRGVARMETFLDDEDYDDFTRELGRWVARGALEIHAFCLMPNHYHVLCSTPEGGLGRVMRHVNGDYVRRFNAKGRRPGRLWQGRYKAILVEDGAYFLECSRYIHLNPNRAKLTRPAERWRWSSYRNYVGGPAAVPWVHTKRTLAAFGGDRAAYRAYVESGKGEEPISPFERTKAGLVLGGEAFLKAVLQRLEGRKDLQTATGGRELAHGGRASPEVVEAAVESLFQGQTPRRMRRLRLYGLRKHSRLHPVEIASRCGRTPAAVTLAVRDLAKAAAEDPALRQTLARLAERFGDD